MKRYATDRSKTGPKPVERVEVREGSVKKRVILLIVAVLVALGAFYYGISSLTRVAGGWRVIEATSASEMNCAQDFVFQYFLGGSGVNAAAENKALSMLYTKATEQAYQIFNSREASLEHHNLYYLNRSINQPVQVPRALYEALALIEKTGSRYIYLGPALQEYHSLFFCTEDWETEGFDPYQNEDVKIFLQTVADFAADPGHVQVALLGNDTVQLNVSDEYQAFARENGVTDYLDLYILQDAFILDYLADTMEENGYTRGMISSYDGYTRCLSDEGLEYSCPFYSPVDARNVQMAAQVNYPGGTSLVHFHQMRLQTQKELYYYQFQNGDTRHAYLDEKDGLCKAALPVLMGTSHRLGCAETAMRLLPFFAADTLDEAGLKALESQGIYPLYALNGVFTTADRAVSLDKLAEGYQAP